MYKFENLIVWKKALELVKSVYLFTDTFKDFGLKDQTRRAVTSICLNIAEGSGAENDKEFKRYLYIARKSLIETVACLRIVHEVYKVKNDRIELQIDEVGKLLNGFIKKIKSDL